MRYILIGVCLFGFWCAATRFLPGLVLGMSLPVLLGVAVVVTFVVSHRIPK